MSYRSRPSRPYARLSFKPKPHQLKPNIDPNKYIQAATADTSVAASFQPRYSFAGMGLHQTLCQNLTTQNIATPTPIQDQIIPLLLKGQDVIGLANTGTGKTLAFLLPLVHHLLHKRIHQVLILAPTRELAIQIHQDTLAISRSLSVPTALCIGGASMQPQRTALMRQPSIIIGTPGRILDFIKQGTLRLNRIDAVVLDEVDRMLDIGFRKDIEYILSELPNPHLSAFFSATTDTVAQSIMMRHSNEPTTVSLTINQTNQHIDQDIIPVASSAAKVDVLHALLLNPEFTKVIVFGRTKHGINRLERQLLDKGLSVSAIHGNKSQNARQHSLQQFRLGHVRALLATDIAARGIDIDHVSHVINFDEPQTYQDYIHRVGRTGRAGNAGKALTFVTNPKL